MWMKRSLTQLPCDLISVACGLLFHDLTCTCGGIHPGRVEPAWSWPRPKDSTAMCELMYSPYSLFSTMRSQKLAVQKGASGLP